jgi:AraC-like DNA-binding protein
MDKLSTLLGRTSFNARVFFNGDFCDTNQFRADGVSGHLHLVRSGPVSFEHDTAAPLLVTEPAMVFYPRGMSHRLAIPDGETATLLCAVIHFKDGLANPLARVLPDLIHIPLAAMAPLRHTLDLLFAEASAGAEGSNLILDRLCDVLMIQALRQQFEAGDLDAGMLAGLADRYLAPVLEAIHGRPQEPWQLQSLAELACMSRARFTEHFRSLVGMPPIEYLTRWRIGLACDLLRKGLAVKVVSAQVGYTSAAAFTRAFSDHMGRPPREWLRKE